LSGQKIFPIRTETSCQYKWTWSTIHLKTGYTFSCHRAAGSFLDVNQFDSFHNTPLKLEARKLMLEGKWPGHGCEYCQKIEQAGGISDRMFSLNIPDLTPPEFEYDSTAINTTPRILEIYINDTCNLSCVYCNSFNSSKINHENKKFQKDTNLDTTVYTSFKILEDRNNRPYLAALWSWLDNHAKDLKRLHILGGEPFYQEEFDEFLDYFERNPQPHLEFNVVSNLSLKKSKLEDYMNRFKQLIASKKIRRFDLTCSIDCWGPEQEFVRTGLNLSSWEENFNYLLTLPWLVLNINQTISPLTIKTMPDLLIKLNEWKKIKSVNQFFSGVTPDPSYLKPDIFGPRIFEKDFTRILELMPENTHQEQQAKKYMTGIWLEIQASNRNEEEIQKLIVFLDEIDRRRRTNWRNLFPWIELV